MRIFVSVLLLTLVCLGCYDTSNPYETYRRVEVDSPAHSNRRTFTGPKVWQEDMGIAVMQAFSRGNNTQYRIWSMTHWDEWPRFRQAITDNGDRLDIEHIDSDINCTQYGCRVMEQLAVPLSRRILNTARKSELNITLLGTRGVTHIVIPGAYVQGFLAKVDGREMSPASAADDEEATEEIEAETATEAKTEEENCQ